ncbi:MAG: thiamine-monophosphate kinase [Planctomycetes bacterium]|nr:thiamine-monophosphate kinase [Planctomycetota bacterium]
MDKSENNLVAWIAERLGKANASEDSLPIGIGDDMAMIRPGGAGVLIAADMLMDGVDFDSAIHEPERIGRKALAVNLSDCAAMAVQPRYALVSLALPNGWSMGQAQRLYVGMEELAKRYGVRIIGGDTNSWDKPMVIDVTVVAEPWPGVRPVTRSGMKQNDILVVTGNLGGSISGHHLDFEPRVLEAKWLAEKLGDNLHAMMDISDGLSIDAMRMCDASGSGIEFNRSMLESVASRSALAAAKGDPEKTLNHVLNDGEDFELLFAVDANAWTELRESPEGRKTISPHVSPRYTGVGRALHEPGVWLCNGMGIEKTPITAAGWQHFK